MVKLDTIFTYILVYNTNERRNYMFLTHGLCAQTAPSLLFLKKKSWSPLRQYANIPSFGEYLTTPERNILLDIFHSHLLALHFWLTVSFLTHIQSHRYAFSSHRLHFGQVQHVWNSYERLRPRTSNNASKFWCVVWSLRRSRTHKYRCISRPNVRHMCAHTYASRNYKIIRCHYHCLSPHNVHSICDWIFDQFRASVQRLGFVYYLKRKVINSKRGTQSTANAKKHLRIHLSTNVGHTDALVKKRKRNMSDAAESYI